MQTGLRSADSAHPRVIGTFPPTQQFAAQASSHIVPFARGKLAVTCDFGPFSATYQLGESVMLVLQKGIVHRVFPWRGR